MKLTQKLPSPTGVASGGGSLVSILPIGLSYEELYIVFTGTIAIADMTNIRINANGKPIQEFRSGTELDLYNKFNRRTAAVTNGILVVDFCRRLLTDRGMHEFTRLGTGKPLDLNQFLGSTTAGSGVPNPNYNPFPVQTLTLEMDLGVNVGATAAVSVFAHLSDPAPTGLIRKLRKFNYGPSQTPFDIADIPKGDMINAWYLNFGVKITDLELKRDNYTIFKRSRTLNRLIQTDGTWRTPQTGMEVIDTTEDGFGDQVITTAGVNDFRLTLTFSTTPTTLTPTVDFIGQLDR